MLHICNILITLRQKPTFETRDEGEVRFHTSTARSCEVLENLICGSL